jgi:transcriptional regulator NrdR family protein
VFTTRETARGDNAFVIKRNGARQRFLYEKLFASIFAVLSVRKDRDNGDNAELAKKLAERVMDGMAAMLGGTNEVPTAELIVMVYKELKAVSKVLADYYLHYSDYRLRIAIERKLVTVPASG